MKKWYLLNFSLILVMGFFLAVSLQTVHAAGQSSVTLTFIKSSKKLTLKYDLVSNLRGNNSRTGTAGVYKGSCMSKPSSVIEGTVDEIKDGDDIGQIVQTVNNITQIPNNQNWHFCLFLSDSTSSG